jgi:hypothetical protein
LSASDFFSATGFLATPLFPLLLRGIDTPLSDLYDPGNLAGFELLVTEGEIG